MLAIAVFALFGPPHLADRISSFAPSTEGQKPAAGAALVYVLILRCSSALWTGLLGLFGISAPGYPGLDRLSHAPALAWAEAASSVAAGIGEELLLLALPLALAARTKLPALAALALMLVPRWLIHTSYGPGSGFVLFWVPAAFALYRACGSIWPLILAHILSDLAVDALNVWPDGTVNELMFLVLFAAICAGGAVLLVGARRWVKTRGTNQPAVTG